MRIRGLKCDFCGARVTDPEPGWIFLSDDDTHIEMQVDASSACWIGADFCSLLCLAKQVRFAAHAVGAKIPVLVLTEDPEEPPRKAPPRKDPEVMRWDYKRDYKPSP